MLREAVILMLFPAAMAFAAASDLVTMTISNKVSLVLVAGFAVLALWTGMDLTQLAGHAAAGAIVLVAGFTCFACGWIGGGDAKLAAVTALWLGLPHLLEYLLVASVLGGALTLFLLQVRQFPLPAVLAAQSWATRLHSPGGDVPYGIALAAAALIVYPNSVWMTALV